MNIQDAAHATVHDYPGGASSLGPRLGMVVAVLNSKVNPNTTTHHLTLAESVRVMEMSGDYRILAAMCEQMGFLPPVKRAEVVVSDAAILDQYAHMLAELGDFSREFYEALRDNKIQHREVVTMNAEMLELIQAALTLMQRIREIEE